MKNLKTKLIIVFFLCSIISNAQVGIGTSTPEATLDITAANLTPTTVDGLLIPRISRLRAKTMTGITTSTLVYINDISDGDLLGTTANVNSVGFYYWNGTIWIRLSTSSDSDAWKTIGNSGTNATTNFLGTTDNVDLIFKRNNLQSGKLGTTTTSFGVNALNPISTGIDNVAIGTSALSSNTTGFQGTAIGYQALTANTTGNALTALGWRALATNSTGSNSTGIGFKSLTSNTTGTNNTGVGFESLNANSTGSFSTAVGFQAAAAQTTATGNTAVGALALTANTAGDNTAVGYRTMIANTTGSSNVAVGTNALATNTNGGSNVAIGHSSLAANSSASNNTAIGFQALTANSTGGGNTAVGTQASSLNSTGSSNTSLGYQAQQLNTTGSQNVAVGERASGRNSGSGNTTIGWEAMFGATSSSSNSTAVGWHALFSNRANNNTAIGYDALQGNTTALGNTAVGSSTLRINTGANNTAMGTLAGDEHGSGANNTYVGFEAGRYNTGTANNNAFFGHQAGLRSTGSFNTAIGSNSLLAAGASANNVAIGYNALRNNIGTGNVALGYQAGLNETTSNKLYIENSNANANTALIYGEFDTNIVRINGTLQISNPAAAPGYSLPNIRGTAGQVLQTNGAGLTSWTSVSGLETDPQVSSATNNRIPRWNTATTTLVDGIINDDGTNIGIGIAPSAGNKLHVDGKTRTTDFQMTNGATPNYILQSDATGNATWVNPSTIAITEADPQVSSTTNNRIPKWNNATTTLVDGIITDDGTNVTVAGNTITTNLQMTNGATANYILQSDATGNATWVNPSTIAITETDPQVSSTTNNRIPKWDNATTTLVDGIMTDDGTNVTVAGNTITTNFQMTNGASPNYFLQSDATGNGTWAPIPVNTVKPFTTTGTLTGIYDIPLTEYTVRVFNDVSEVRLPNAAGNQGKIFIIIGSNTIGPKIFSTAGGAIYDDVTNLTITTLNPNERYMVQSDGTGWLVIGR